ncbi:hypothetical protein ABB37_05216 [Leptomonas pyrrhocoris]|uniref:Uncharacterized protein n=1 Tax=Leptomonas pyrrhocoris TaxID=157538 RepID=A0A0M9G139_LEPPY|nr:hypothetical protein ABB37_05216 [Leptomonas pyrrhocoris]KPA80250.1 hypothetical protein ABB37_05216 [Leptomonas pyrrhocoris]|eukprot:XP_015658689.1 hypothetical protein ABB37_05216 [Leptomonas pyrrhocoris]
MQAEAHAVHLAYRALAAHLRSIRLHVYVDNASVGYSPRKRLAKATAIAAALQAIELFEREVNVHATYTYTRSGLNPADAPSRGRRLTDFDWANQSKTFKWTLRYKSGDTIRQN